MILPKPRDFKSAATLRRTCLIAIGNHHVRAALRKQMRHFAANAACAANNQRNAPAELLLRRLTANLRLFQRPVFNAESLNRRQRHVVGKHLEARRIHALAALRHRPA